MSHYFTYKIDSLENQELHQVLLTWGEDMVFSKAVNYALDLRTRYPHLKFKIKQDKELSTGYCSPEEWEYN